MLKSINWAMNEISVPCDNLKTICKASINIPNVQNGVTVKCCEIDKFCGEMRSFDFSTQKLTITGVDFNEIYNRVIKNSHLRKNIFNLTINGKFSKYASSSEKLQEFANFLSKNFPNLNTLNATFVDNNFSALWNWNDDSMAKIFQQLSPDIKGCISFITKSLTEVDQIKYPDVQRCNDEYYKNFPITDSLCFKMVQKIEAPVFNDYIFTFDNYAFSFAINSTLDEKPKNAPFDRKNFAQKPVPIFKNQRSYKSARNRFTRRKC